jgi:hypothetical protein
MKNTSKLLAILSLSFCLSSCQKEFSIENDLSSPQVAFDTDAQSFISISGITVDAEKTCVNNFVKQLKDSGLWTKFRAIYPMVGGTASTTKWNLKDPRDLDVAYRLTFKGTPVYATTGVIFPTISDYADTHLADSELNYNDNSISYYSRTQNTVDGYDMGCLDHGSPYNEMAIYHTGDASNWFGYYKYGSAPANTVGLFMFSATVSDVKRYENGVVKNSSGASPVKGATGYSILLGTVKGASSGGSRECALATIGNGLTDAEALTFYNIVQNFETKLNR